MRGRMTRASEPGVAKPISIKGSSCRSGRCAAKAVGLTSGDLRRVSQETGRAARPPTATQKSAEGVVVVCSRPTRSRHSPERGETVRDRRAGNGMPKARTVPRKG